MSQPGQSPDKSGDCENKAQGERDKSDGDLDGSDAVGDLSSDFEL